ncbi:D-alanyl-D-alanine carboxypeptidase family protein [Dysosmobacter sp.]|uniref:D-alanyl-D-alanine carboxypeptidase family protein n=1 Tax=Dysosmobacter sp. TaxID=2591382 RepID=UPI002A9B4543|nr:D-alanyl-D-alanine carboxypeptidase family protein [Dysosmobacter sp.]MDY5611865.1 D-alanyl-D-alanine carboxypeptidase family protein [Dysosmobacter sp.]
MKTNRFFALFLALVLSLCLFPTAYAAGDEKPELPADPDILAKAALLVDANTGAVAYAKNEHEELYPASLTKIMTALLTLEAIDAGKLSMDQELTATATALEGLSSDGSSAGIKVGETMSVRNLLYCMLVVSANEACDILAEAVSGSVPAFVEAMNAKAAALGCENTHFVNPNGLHDPQHYTSAWDMYLITRAAMEYPDFMTICDTAAYTVPATNISGERKLYTTNHLLSNWRVIGYRNTEAHGIKTGSTDAAGHCLVSSAMRGSLHFISVVLGADRVVENGVGNIRSFSETTRMFNYGFDNFTYKTIVEEKEIIQEVPVSLSKMDHVTVHPARDIEVLLPKVLDAEDLERTITLEEPVEAPVEKGQKLGTMVLSYDGVTYASVDLLASFDVEASKLMTFWRDVKAFFAKTSVRVGLIVLAVLIVVLVLCKLLFGRRRYRYGRSVGRRGGGNYRGRRRH